MFLSELLSGLFTRSSPVEPLLRHRMSARCLSLEDTDAFYMFLLAPLHTLLNVETSAGGKHTVRHVGLQLFSCWTFGLSLLSDVLLTAFISGTMLHRGISSATMVEVLHSQSCDSSGTSSGGFPPREREDVSYQIISGTT